MRKSLIFFSILIVAFLAFIDAKDRIAELEEIAANTPSQVEMKQMIDKPKTQVKNHIYDKNSSQFKQQDKKNFMQNRENPTSTSQFDIINERRNSIHQKVN